MLVENYYLIVELFLIGVLGLDFEYDVKDFLYFKLIERKNFRISYIAWV